MPRFDVGDVVVRIDDLTVLGRIVETVETDPPRYEIRWAPGNVRDQVAEDALMPAPADLDEQQLEDDAGSLD
jgi:hypothetical protein